MPRAKKCKTETATPIHHARKDTSHIRMVAWLAVAAVAVSSGSISYSANASSSKSIKRADPMVGVMRQLDELRVQVNQNQSDILRIQLELQALKNPASVSSTNALPVETPADATSL